MYGDEELVAAGVLVLEEKAHLNIGWDILRHGYWGNEEEFEEFSRLQVAAMAADAASAGNVIPVSDSANAHTPLEVLLPAQVRRASGIQAATLALHAVASALPAFDALNDTQVLEVRDRLHDELAQFRLEMLQLAPTLRKLLDEASCEELHAEAKYVIDTGVLPAVQQLKRRLEAERSAFWRRVLLKGAAILPKMAVAWVEKGALQAALAGLGQGLELADEASQDCLARLTRGGGLSFLLKLSEMK